MYIHEAVINALSKLSEHGKISKKKSDLTVVDVLVAEFRESIKPAIPQMITLLGSWQATDVIHEAVANALSKLSEHGKISKKNSNLTIVNVLVVEFQESIMHAIPKIIAFFSVTELNLRKVAADALSKLSGQGNM
jgi:hypothetical protein